MGQSYNITLRFRVRNERGAINALNEKIKKGHEDRVRYHPEDFDVNTIDGLIHVGFYHKMEHREKDGWHYYSADFDACYGWEIVMIEWFKILAPYCEPDASLTIYPDRGHYTLTWDGTKVNMQ